VKFVNGMRFVTDEVRQQAVIDVGEFETRRLCEHLRKRYGLVTGEGIIKWTRIRDYEKKYGQESEPSGLPDSTWVLEMTIPIIKGDIPDGIHLT